MTDSEKSQHISPTPSLEKSGSAGYLFNHPPFLNLFFGSLTATLGDRIYQMAAITAVIIIFSSLGKDAESGSEERIMWIQLAGTLPQFLLYPFVGPYVDERDRRKLLRRISMLKAALVLLFVPLLWGAISSSALNSTVVSATEQFDRFRLPWIMALIFLISLISLPFSPARGATIPDVAPSSRLESAASLVATTGLVSILLGTLGGEQMASGLLRPSGTAVVASLLFLVSASLFRSLPDAASVPGIRHTPEKADNATKQTKPGEYFRELFDGWRYCQKTSGIVILIVFESLFWLFAMLVYFIYQWHARVVLELEGIANAHHFAWGLGCAGIGLFLGAVAIGRVCRWLSPLLSYPFALLVMSWGTGMVLGQQAGSAHYVYPWMTVLGFGGGFLLARVDADVLVLCSKEMRGRVFAAKGFFFTGALVGSMALLASLNLDLAQKAELAAAIPRALAWLAVGAVFASWSLDCALWRDRGDFAPPGPIRRSLWGLIRAFTRLICRIYFRAEIRGLEKVPKTGPCILAANHGCFLDPFLLGAFSPRYVYYIMALVYYRSFAHPMFRFFRTMPVDQTAGSLKALRAGTTILAKGDTLGIFPEGRVNADGRLQKPQTGVVFLAKQSGATVVPIAIKGNHGAMPRGQWFPKPKKITLLVGTPFTVDRKASKKELAERTDSLMEELAKLLELPPPPKCAGDDTDANNPT